MGTEDAAPEKLIEDLLSLPDKAGRLEFLSRNSSLHSPATVKLLDDAVSEYVRKDLKKAQELAETAAALAQDLGDYESQAHASRAQANALWFSGHNQQAAELHKKAIEHFEESGNALETARTLSVSIQPLILLGEYDRALAAAERAREIFTSRGEAVRLARLEINVGNIFHRQDRFREALDCYERAYQQLLPDKDAEGIIAALHNIAVCLITLNDYQRALSTYEQVRAFCRARNMPLAAAQADYNIAYLFYFRGEYARAIDMLRVARENCERTGDAYHTALCHLDLSEIYLELNAAEDSAEMAQEAFRSFQELGMGYESAKALSNSAIALSQQGKGFRALELFAQARAIFVKEKNLVWPSLIDLYRSLVYLNEGRLFESRRYALAALEFFRTSPLPGRAILCRLILARLAEKTGDMDAARAECEKVLQDLTGKESPILLYQVHLVTGEIEEATHHPQEAMRHYQAAKDVLESLRSRVYGEELKISFVSNRLEVYENIVNLCLAQPSSPGSSEQAWGFMEQAKSRSLLELISRAGAPSAPEGSGKSELVRRIRDLREQLNWYYHRIEAEQLGQTPISEKRLQELRELADDREKEFLRVLREAPSSDAEAAGFESPAPLSLDTLRQALGPQTALIEYFRVRERILAVVVTANKLEIQPITPVTRVAQILRALQFQFSKFRLGQGYIRELHPQLLRATQAHLNELYRELIAPIRSQVSERHLVVVPHEILHYVPFHALYDGEQYLLDHFTVSYAPSASVYVQCHSKQANTTGTSLILGVPDAQTPSIYEELQSVATMLPSAELFLGANASEKVLREKGAQSRLIHIATHGFFRKDNPMFSGIRLGDTFLTLYDLYGMNLPADQITLSGCSTGLSVVAAGDELIGLVRGLLSAGARSLLLTLWDVNDSSTAQFMKAFYGRLYNHAERALALREAMQELRDRYPHPYYWAPFVLVGKVFAF